jgi:AraC-like DNA-binding protein
VAGPVGQIDAATALVVYTARSLLGKRTITPTRIELQRAPPHNVGAFERTFRCPVSFGADGNRIVWPAALIEARLEGANPELARHSEALLTTYLAGIHKDNTVAQVRACLAEPGCSISEVAYLLGFADTSNFTRAFRRWTGQSPTEHRRASGSPDQTSRGH